MTGRSFLLSPVDSWFFRDGRPYNKGEANQTDVKSVFPPFAPTAVGVLRAAFGRSMGWSGSGDWPDEIKSKLGDGRDLGPLTFKGPYLVRSAGKDGGQLETLFPAPLHLLGAGPRHRDAAPCGEKDMRTWFFSRLRPGKEEGIPCDLGKVRLPEPVEGSKNDERRMKPLSGYFLTRTDLETVLNGERLNGIKPIRHDELWKHEFNVGIERNEITLTTDEGALFSRQFVRPARGVSIIVCVDGIGDGVNPEPVVPFGGEGRMAYIDELGSRIPLIPEPVKLKSSATETVRFTITFLTPADLSVADLGPGKEIPCLPGVHLISACIGKPVRIGGWDSRIGKKRPLPLRLFIPAGSTLFCEATGAEVPENGSHIGFGTNHGFGEIAIGIWNDTQDKEDR